VEFRCQSEDTGITKLCQSAQSDRVLFFVGLQFANTALRDKLNVAENFRPVWARGRCRKSPPRFLAECCKRQLNQGSVVLLYFRLSTFSDLY